jgi:DNA gyrase/topoisomerase IV subunit A
MITPDKIDEWIKEAENRPTSAPLIIQLIANRLRDLSERNEALLAENIALLTGKRVEEYEQRINHLEYQLQLLKRQLSGEIPADIQMTSANQISITPPVETLNFLVYTVQGSFIRLVISSEMLSESVTLAQLAGELDPTQDIPRLLIVPTMEELLLVFTSGRVATLPVTGIPVQSFDRKPISWKSAPIPIEPRAGESLACVAPLSKLALTEFFVQASRRGYVKKINAGMSQSILSNHYIGTGVIQPRDQGFSLSLGGKDDRLALVSREGYLQCLEVKKLSFSAEESIRLGISDHLVAAFIITPGQFLLFITQTGKVIHWTEDRLETAQSLKTKGQSLFSQQRREQGVRLIGAASVQDEDWGVALHQDGELTLHTVRGLSGSGSLAVRRELIAFATFSPQRKTGIPDTRAG